ncbi:MULTISPECIES: PP2C family protein-serine/threonine phosphatase [unclassified Streptomyces]|uniref:PP2C family protein-serine/threonine phosphatase n=1 Tax=unclassified Streptomyces TaxID=2593676 RepID=UPI001316C8AD|nr:MULTISPECIES: PP2C family protein-serine/threonine phosphatase [unclassified Streptomyces]QHC32922.1 SpoIIE family protein phosphatase [Streptomyces sp. HF10]WKE73410.1 PP2C family protein-serine/threonine phosphatase [Streptomyces sp. WP-1]
MTTTCDTWTLNGPVDAARARALLARLTADAGVPARDRARFLAALTALLRPCREGRRQRLTVTAGQDLHIALDGTEPWRHTLACSAPLPRPLPRPDDLAEADLAEALLGAGEDTAVVLAGLDEAEELVRFHREELHQTNQGVLALHAELEAAALAQRELLDAERAARAEAENARRLLTFLADASASLNASLDHEDILRRLPKLLVPEYARHVDVWLVDDERTPPAERAAAAVTAARTGRPQHAGPRPGGLPGVDDLPASALSPDRPLLCLPLGARTAQGVLTLSAPGERFAPDTAVMLLELARRAGIALDNARQYEQHRDVAEALQRAQLTELPDTTGLALAARYLPATHGLNIGGDWYDAFPGPDGSVLAVIGDVTGHGLRAAVIMGQLRTALRAYAVEGNGPARILTLLHRMLRHQQPELYATCAIARFTPGEPGVVWAAAGHPPALVRGPGGEVRVLDAKPGIMLGVPVPYEYEEHHEELPAGATLALYTDGLVERRSAGIDAGIERLATALGTLGAAELERLDGAADALLEPMLRDSEHDDDICLLLCRTAV